MVPSWFSRLTTFPEFSLAAPSGTPPYWVAGTEGGFLFWVFHADPFCRWHLQPFLLEISAKHAENRLWTAWASQRRFGNNVDFLALVQLFSSI
eukprot:g60565.t1